MAISGAKAIDDTAAVGAIVPSSRMSPFVAPSPAVQAVLRRPPHADGRRARLLPRPLHALVQLLRRVADRLLLGAVEVRLREERTRDEKRRGDRRELDRLEALARAHVE